MDSVHDGDDWGRMGNGEDYWMNEVPELAVKIELTEDEISLIQFFIFSRDAIAGYREIMRGKDTHLGQKMLLAQIEVETLKKPCGVAHEQEILKDVLKGL